MEKNKKKIRLDKFLTQVIGITRSEAKQYLKKGRIQVNGIRTQKPELKIDPEKTIVTVDGKQYQYEEYVYLMLNKPKGVVSATEDVREKTVLQLIKEPKRGLFPVGRLDKDTEGLLLLTNDGALAHALLSPKKHVDKCYYAVLDQEVGEQEQKQFAQGLDIGEEKKTLPAKLIIAQPVKKLEEKGFGVYITIQEGRYHQIKRMAKAVGREVLYLKRISMGNLKLDENLLPGEYRFLTQEEQEQLRNSQR